MINSITDREAISLFLLRADRLLGQPSYYLVRTVVQAGLQSGVPTQR
jgi:hypothetical protein